MQIIIRSLLLIVSLILSFSCLDAQSRFTISGYIHDAATGDALISASVYDLKSLEGSYTNEYGFFSITLNEGEVRLTASYLGYQTFGDTILLKQNITRNIQLKSGVELQEVVVTADEDNRKIEERTQMSAIDFRWNK
jgi:hypothetical protein